MPRPPSPTPRIEDVFLEGNFLWANFPFGPPEHRPYVPGPKPHICYVLATSDHGADRLVLLAYTSSGPWRGATSRIPIGVIEVDEAAARSLGQVPFHIDLRCVARVRPTKSWFPRIDNPEGGVVGVANRRLRHRIESAFRTLASRSLEIIEIRGVPGP